ncbi:hypothetical protein [Vibrio sp. JZG120]
MGLPCLLIELSNKADIERSSKIGISDHIAKPINFTELEKVLAKWLSQQLLK